MASFVQDSSGNWYALSVDGSGNLLLTPVVGAGTSTAPPLTTNSNETIQKVVNWASTHVELMPITSVGGYTDEPALSLANDTIQELCAAPLAWEFNQVDAPLLVTQLGLQEQPFAGAAAFTTQYGASIDLSSNVAVSQVGSLVTVQCLHAHNFSVGNTVFMVGNDIDQYNSVFTQLPSGSSWSGGWTITAVPTPTSFQFNHTITGLQPSGAPGIYDYGWLQSGTMLDMNSGEPVPKVWEVQAVRTLKKTSQEGRPRKFAITKADAGIVYVRFEYVPNSTVWGVTMTYQKKPPVKQSLADTWAPFPDEYGFVYRQMFLARCYRYLDHKRADAEHARAMAMIQKATAAADREDSDQYVSPQHSLMDGGYGW